MQIDTLIPGSVHRLAAVPVTTTQLVKYAGASGDFNRIHFDEPFARGTGLPGVLAHGMLTMAVAGRCVDALAGSEAHIAEFSAQFTAPVLVGDVVEVAATVDEVEASQRVRLSLVARVGDKTVLKGQALLDYAGAPA